MKTFIKRYICLLLAIIGIIFVSNVCYAQISSGQGAPAFSLQDINGKGFDLSGMKQQPLTILYFFDIESRPSQEGLLSLHSLVKKYKGTDLVVWAITTSNKEKVTNFVKSTGISFPILLDNSTVSSLYNARMVLPTICSIGPGLKILDYFQGGGKTTESMLVRVAERELQRKQTTLAKAISDEVIKKNPQNVKAKAVKGYAALKDGNLKDAEKTFTELQKEKDGKTLGKEGMAVVYTRKNQPEKALQMVKEVEQEAPDRSYVHVIKGDILYSQNKKKEAEAAYKTAVKKKDAEPYHEAVKYNQLGRLYASSGEYKKAHELYDQAIAIDPYYIEGTTNKGLAYEKEGKWDKALESYRQALDVEKNDSFALVLAKKAQEMLDLQKDIERKKRTDQLVKDLAERYRTQKRTMPENEDTWTSRPMVLSFVDIQEKGGLAERDGFATVLMTQLADYLNGSGRVKVVDRVLIERLLEELNLGTSELADPETALKLGKILAAKLIGTGSIFYMPHSTLLSLRLIDTETSAIPQVTTKQFEEPVSVEKELLQLNREILKTVILKYPLRGYIVKSSGEDFIVNLGSNQGVVQGTKFEVIEEQEPVKYKGKTLKASPKAIAEIEVVTVEPDMCYVHIAKQYRPLKSDDKVQERIIETAQ